MFIIVGVFAVAAILMLVWISVDRGGRVEERECAEDADCVPDECCDARQCVPAEDAPYCVGVLCPLGCKNYGDNSTGCDTDIGPVNTRGECICNDEGKCESTYDPYA